MSSPVEYRRFTSSGIAAGEHTHIYKLGTGLFKLLGLEVIYSNASGFRNAIPIKISWVPKRSGISYWNQLDSGFVSQRHGFGLKSQHEIEGPGTLRIIILNADPAAAMTSFISYRRVDH